MKGVKGSRLEALLVLASLFAVSYSQDILFEDNAQVNSNRGCPPQTRCIAITSCPAGTALGLGAAHHQLKICGFTKKIPHVCCNLSEDCGRLGTHPRRRQEPTGRSFDPILTRHKRVIGGQPVSPTKFWPWVALVGERESPGETKWLCGASLINENWLITALHCFLHAKPNVVRLGEHDHSREDEGSRPKDFNIEQVVYNPNFTFPAQNDDIALIRINRTANAKDGFRPVCLPSEKDDETSVVGKDLLLVGWGTTSFGGSRSPTPNEVNMTVFEPTVCNNSYSQLRTFSIEYPRGIDHSFLCMGAPEGGVSACQGDSGGPLMYVNAEGKYLLAGAVANGYGCGAKDFPGVHSNLVRKPLLTWIKDVAFS